MVWYWVLVGGLTVCGLFASTLGLYYAQRANLTINHDLWQRQIELTRLLIQIQPNINH
jgi:hypothetical protein